MPPDSDQKAACASRSKQSAGADNTQVIAPIDFQPLDTLAKRPGKRIPWLMLIVVAALLISAAVMWFLMTARALTINVTPEQATTKISGGAAFALADHYLLRPGEYTLQVTAAGHVTFTENISITTADHQQRTIVLQKLPGHLAITGHPEGAEIFINGELSGTTPSTVRNLPAGVQKLAITAPRYLPLKQDISVVGLDQTQELAINLQPAWGHLTLHSEPTGATILVGGVNRGITPATVPVLASGEPVELSLSGYQPWQQSMRVPIGTKQTWPLIKLAPADAQVMVHSRPDGASITLNGRFVGTTPKTLSLSPQTSHQISLFLDGYQTLSRTLNVKSAEKTRLDIELKARLGSVEITTAPTNADIYIDGDNRGKSPLSLTLPARPWRLEVRHPGYRSESQTVTPKPGVGQVVHIKMRSEAEARRVAVAASITSPVGQKLQLFRPADTFTLGASRREQGRRANEIMREVTLTRPFYLSLTEVSNAQFKKFRNTHSSSHANSNTLDSSTQPVVNLDWTSAAQFCNWLSMKDKLEPFYIENDGAITGSNPQSTGYRLPTEAEWEWAARRQNNGKMLKYPWGDNFPPTAKIANIADQTASKILRRTIPQYLDGYAVSAPVGSFPPNHLGLHDMGGNVSEWLNDYYSIAVTLGSDAVTDPSGPDSGEYRVIRGASWRHSSITELRLSFRDYGNKPRDDLGFRIARYAE